VRLYSCIIVHLYTINHPPSHLGDIVEPVGGEAKPVLTGMDRAVAGIVGHDGRIILPVGKVYVNAA
jgi:hypothetical protein